jgi:hypothetical protein
MTSFIDHSSNELSARSVPPAPFSSTMTQNCFVLMNVTAEIARHPNEDIDAF